MCWEVEDGIHAMLGEVAMDHTSKCHQPKGWIGGTVEDGRWSCFGSCLNLHHVGNIACLNGHEGWWPT